MSLVHTGVFRPLIASVLLAALAYGLIGVLAVVLISGSLLGLRTVWIGRRERALARDCSEGSALIEDGRRA